MTSLRDEMAAALAPDADNPVHVVSLRREGTDQVAEAVGSVPGRPDLVVTPDHAFRIASISKMITAVLILRLVDQGRLRLDDPAALALADSDLPLSRLQTWQGRDEFPDVTVRHLLGHTSGIADYITSPDFLELVYADPSRQWSGAELLRWAADAGIGELAVGHPGVHMHYSDTNYVLLGLIAEAVVGDSLENALTQEILDPLGLDDTYLEFHQVPRGTAQLVHPYAGEITLKQVNTSFDWGGGGLVSTHRDLHRFIRALFEGRVLEPATRDQMLSVRAENEPRFLFGASSSAYGLGIRQLTVDGRSLYGHSGSWGCLVAYEPASRTSISVAVNQSDAAGALGRLLRAGLAQGAR